MRLLNRPHGWRSSLAAPSRTARRARWSCCSGLLLTGALYAAFAPAQAGRPRPTPTRSRRAASCSSSAARSATARTARASQHPRRQQHRPVAGRRGRRRGRLPGRHRPDADGPAGRPGPSSKAAVYTDEEIAALAAYVASLGAGPAIPDASRLQHRGPLRRGARGGHRPRRPDLPDQLHGLPQLRGLRRRHAARRLRPEDPRRRSRSTSTRRC